MPTPTSCAPGPCCPGAVGSRASRPREPGGHGLPASTPITGEALFTVAQTTSAQAEHTIADAAKRFRLGGPHRRRCAARWWPGWASC